MRREIAEAFEAAVDVETTTFDVRRERSEKRIRRDATILMKQVERLIECLEPGLELMTLLEFYEEIAGQAWRRGGE